MHKRGRGKSIRWRSFKTFLSRLSTCVCIRRLTDSVFLFNETVCKSMGCSTSKVAAPKAAELSEFDKRIAVKLKSFQAAHNTKEKGMVASFDQVILKFPKINACFKKVKDLFDKCDDDGNGTLEYDEIRPFLAKLGTQNMTEDEIKTVFSNADFYHNNHLTHKEFMVCLALGYVLEDIKVGDSEAGAGDMTPRTTEMASIGPELKSAFDWVLGAYLIFDSEGTGVLNKDEVLRQMVAKEGAFASRGASSVLSKERWEELDFDHDGSITFKEFFWAFQGWVASEDEDEE